MKQREPANATKRDDPPSTENPGARRARELEVVWEQSQRDLELPSEPRCCRKKLAR
jgi:hypothetical protein